MATRDLDSAWGALNLSKPEAARDALVQVAPLIVARYGDAAATVSGDWYDEMRATAAPRAKRFTAILADSVQAEQVEASVRYAAGHLFTDAPDLTLSVLTGAVQRYVMEPARETVVNSVARDPARPGWSRVPGGANPCDFCLELASYGVVRSTPDGMGDYHDHCSCVAVPTWD